MLFLLPGKALSLVSFAGKHTFFALGSKRSVTNLNENVNGQSSYQVSWGCSHVAHAKKVPLICRFFRSSLFWDDMNLRVVSLRLLSRSHMWQVAFVYHINLQSCHWYHDIVRAQTKYGEVPHAKNLLLLCLLSLPLLPKKEVDWSSIEIKWQVL